VRFEPFVGVAPRRFLDLFALGDMDRKDGLGNIRHWNGSVAMPRLGEYSFRTEKTNRITESEAFEAFGAELSRKGFAGPSAE
jgi:hypothetical protein